MINGVAVKSGYYFLVFEKKDIPETLKNSGRKIELNNKIYDLYIGTSLEDERKIDDMFGNRMGYSISEYEIDDKDTIDI